MESSPQVWEAWQLSKAYHCRPSEIYGVHHPVQAFYFDRAVWVFGTTLENDLDKASADAKKPKQGEQARLRVLQKWLGQEAIGFAQPQETRRV